MILIVIVGAIAGPACQSMGLDGEAITYARLAQHMCTPTAAHARGDYVVQVYYGMTAAQVATV